MDGGLSRNGTRGAAAAVCRDNQGTFLGASAIVVHSLTDPTCLEALACNEAISLALDLYLTDIQVASDCKEVVACISSGDPSKFAAVIREISHRCKPFNQISFVHEKREFNGEAHALAKAASSLEVGRHVWLVALPDIICIPMNIVEQ